MSTVHEPPVIGPGMAGTRMSPEEFVSLPNWDENYVYELIRGVLVVLPAKCAVERGMNDLLNWQLRSHSTHHPSRNSFNYTLPAHYVRIGNTIRRADRVIWAGLGRMPNVRQDLPAIAVEFVSRDRRDRIRDYEEKRDEYLSVGIQEYWVIDRFRRQMTVFRADGETFAEQVVAEDEKYVTTLLPGFELDLAGLLAEADMHGET